MVEQWGSLEDWKQLAEQRKTVNVQRSMEIDRLRARLEQAEGGREFWEQSHRKVSQRLERMEDDRKRLIQHVAAMGHAITSSDPDYANDSWRSLPEHLQVEIESEEERIDMLESGEGD